MCVIGVWLGTEHHIQDRAILKPIVVVGGGGADAKGKVCYVEWPWHNTDIDFILYAWI